MKLGDALGDEDVRLVFGGRQRDSREDILDQHLDLFMPLTETHPEVENQKITSNLLVSGDSSHDVIRRPYEDRPGEIVNRAE